MPSQTCILENKKNYKQILSLLESETDEECIEIYSTFWDLFLPEDFLSFEPFLSTLLISLSPPHIIPEEIKKQFATRYWYFKI